MPWLRSLRHLILSGSIGLGFESDFMQAFSSLFEMCLRRCGKVPIKVPIIL